MDRTFARRLLISSLVAAGVAATASACSNPDVVLPPSDEIHVAAKAPPAIQGGTMLVTKAGMAVAADPDRDMIWLANLDTGKLVGQIELEDGDHPGRAVESLGGKVHMVLNGAGEVVTIDPAAGKIVNRTHVCTSPRGIAYEAANDRLHVACVGGEVVSLNPANGEAVRKLRVGSDLRDVVVRGSDLVVSTFKSAKFFVISANGEIKNPDKPVALPESGSKGGFNEFDESIPSDRVFSPTVAYRTIKLSNDHLMVVHQRSLITDVTITQDDGYSGGGGECGDGSIVTGAVSEVDPGDGNDPPIVNIAPTFVGTALPVDIAINESETEMLVAAAGSDKVLRINVAAHRNESMAPDLGFTGCSSATPIDLAGEPIAVAYWKGRAFVQIREPAQIVELTSNLSIGDSITLPGESVLDTGHRLFHHAANDFGSLACASCHPGAGEDGHTWKFNSIGARRTQPLGGGVLSRAPFHWDGDLDSMDTLMSEVFVRRMGGQHQGPRHVRVLGKWLDKQPATPTGVHGTQDQIARGKGLFEGSAGCATCHTGEQFTDNRGFDVGTGKVFQVPGLKGIASRAPYFHDGCAPTLKDRFTAPVSCTGGDKHGTISHLSPSDIDDLVAYLETL